MTNILIKLPLQPTLTGMALLGLLLSSAVGAADSFFSSRPLSSIFLLRLFLLDLLLVLGEGLPELLIVLIDSDSGEIIAGNSLREFDSEECLSRLVEGVVRVSSLGPPFHSGDADM